MVPDQWIFGTRKDGRVQNTVRLLYNCVQGLKKESTIVSHRTSFSTEQTANVSQISRHPSNSNESLSFFSPPVFILYRWFHDVTARPFTAGLRRPISDLDRAKPWAERGEPGNLTTVLARVHLRTQLLSVLPDLCLFNPASHAWQRSTKTGTEFGLLIINSHNRSILLKYLPLHAGILFLFNIF